MLHNSWHDIKAMIFTLTLANLTTILGVCKALEPWLTHSCRSLSRFLYHEVAWSISTPPGWDASPSQVTTPQFVRFLLQIASTHLYTWVERGSVRVECLAQEHNTMSPARARTQTSQSGVEYTNHEATLPPHPLSNKTFFHWSEQCQERESNEICSNLKIIFFLVVNKVNCCCIFHCVLLRVWCTITAWYYWRKTIFEEEVPKVTSEVSSHLLRGWVFTRPGGGCYWWSTVQWWMGWHIGELIVECPSLCIVQIIC